MADILPFPTNPVRRLSDRASARLLHRVDAVSSKPPRSAGVDRVADCLLALEAACWAEPCIVPSRTLTRTLRVAVVLPGYDGVLTSAEAREVAQVLRAENAYAGALGTALRLDDVASQTDRRGSDGGPLERGPNGSGGQFLIIALLCAAAYAAWRILA